MLRTTPEDRNTISRVVFEYDGNLSALFQAYDNFAVSGDFAVHIKSNKRVALFSHQDVINTIEHIKELPQSTLQGIQDTGSRHNPDMKGPGALHIINLAVRLIAMVDTEANNRHASGYNIKGYQPTSWSAQESFRNFITKQFPRTPPHLSGNVRLALEEQSTLKAWKLQKRHGIRFTLTNNLAEHLLYDTRHQCLRLFHHTTFLKAQLKKFRNVDRPLDYKLEESLAKGALPPQLLIETLHSLAILFGTTDRESDRILQDILTTNTSADEDLGQFDGYIISNKLPDGFQYQYWGRRIADLHEHLMRNPPRSSFARWFERQSTEGNALFIALLALLISIIVGIVSIGLAVFQAWVAWMAWKHPIQAT
ncbi:hypothetical protein F5883DRAFT_463376 [Diaporthe sp. PMI_573]|nr:hypothetical protein F5883DRAFT_463376 [Diaporthaceae sp. PMI_573]